MIKEYRGNTELDLDQFDGLFEDQVQDRPPREFEFDLPARLPEPWEAEVRTDACSAPHSAELGIIFRRAIRSVSPLVLADVLSLALCGLFAYGVLHFFYPAAAAPYRLISPVALLPLLVAYGMAGLYTEIWVHPILELRSFTHINTMALLAAAAGGVMARPFPLWCAAAWLGAVGLVPLFRSLARHLCAPHRWWGHPTLVVGSAAGADALARALAGAPRSGLRPVLVTDPTRRCRVSVAPVMNDPDQLESLVRAEGIRHAVVSLPELSSARMSELLDRFGGMIPHLLVLSDASTLPTLWGASRRCGRLTGIEVRNGLLLATLGVVKRVFDLSIALVALICGLPLMLGLAILVKLTSRGPIFFGHTRIGQHGKRFKAWKFRSMHRNADSILRDHLGKVALAQEEWERDQKLRRDPRVTRLGALLRKTSLDELPQIWNVLKGDMSLVGPRPIVQDEIARYGKVFRLYTSVKPGITGLWQVSGRNDLGYEERVHLDQFYVRHWSPWLDIYILGRTVITLLWRKGAY
jgi:Undecaprenyl-phosphate galactose phosphotransferase WbaP